MSVRKWNTALSVALVFLGCVFVYQLLPRHQPSTLDFPERGGGQAPTEAAKEQAPVVTQPTCVRAPVVDPSPPTDTSIHSVLLNAWEGGCKAMKDLGSSITDAVNARERIKSAFILCDTIRDPKLTELKFESDYDLVAASRFARSDGWLEEAYIGAVTRASDIAMYERVIKSVHIFSSRPIVIVVCDSENLLPVQYDRKLYPRLIVVRGAHDENYEHSKIRILAIAPIMYSQFLDPGTLIFGTADVTFERLKAETASYDLPILPRHTDEDLIREGKKNTNVQPKHETSPFLRAHVSMAYGSMPRMVQLYQRCRRGLCLSIEGGINQLLWQYKATKYWCRIDPEYQLIFPPHEKDPAPNHLYAFRFVTGIPDASEADRTLAELIRLDSHCVNPLFLCNSVWSHYADPVCVNNDPGCLS